jgi:rubredoxin
MDEVPLPPPLQQQPVPPAGAPISFMCPRCHFAVKPEYYYCPNCGAKLTEPPIGTGLVDQLLLYAFSIVLPWIAYLAITKWQGIKYLRAPDARAKQIGFIALVLLVVSSIIAFWLTYVWIQGYIQSATNQANSFMNGLP